MEQSETQKHEITTAGRQNREITTVGRWNYADESAKLQTCDDENAKLQNFDDENAKLQNYDDENATSENTVIQIRYNLTFSSTSSRVFIIVISRLCHRTGDFQSFSKVLNVYIKSEIQTGQYIYDGSK